MRKIRDVFLLLIVLCFSFQSGYAKDSCPLKDWKAYVTTISSVDVIDVEKQIVIESIEEGVLIDGPTSAVSTLDGKFIYFTNQGSNTVGIVDTSSNGLLDPIPVGLTPYDISLNPTGTHAFVTNAVSESVSIIDLATNSVVGTVSLETGSSPRGIGITNNGLNAYVANLGNSSVSVIDIETLTVTSTIPNLVAPFDVAINSQTGDVYITSNIAPGAYYVINPLDESVSGPYQTGGNGASGIAITSDGQTAYIANYASNQVSVMNLATHSLMTVLDVGTVPRTVAIASDQQHAYAVNLFSDDVTVINLPDNTIDPNPIAVGTEPRSMAITPDSATGYVLNVEGNSLSVVNLLQNTVTETIISTAIFQNPRQLAINPSATEAYVANHPSKLTVIDIGSDQVATDIGIEESPAVVAITPDGTKGYVSNSNIAGEVSVIDIPTNSFLKAITVGSYPNGVAIHPSGATVYVANTGSDTVSMIDVASDKVIGDLTFPSGSVPNNLAFTPDGSILYLSCFGSNSIFAISTWNNQFIAEIPVGDNPQWIAVTPDGAKAYVANTGIASLSVISTQKNEVVNTITFPDASYIPVNIAIASDGSTSFVTLSGQTQVAVIDLAVDEISDYIPVSHLPYGIAITPDQAPTAYFEVVFNKDKHVKFDASSSCSPTGTITLYQWDFGDGKRLETSSPIVTHRYKCPGCHRVTLTVVNSAGTSTEKVFTGQTLYRNGGPSAQKLEFIVVKDLVCPPSHLRGKQIEKEGRFYNVLSWEAPQPCLMEYVIYRDRECKHYVATVSACANLRYEVPVCKGTVETYYVVSVDNRGDKSEPACVTVEPLKS